MPALPTDLCDIIARSGRRFQVVIPSDRAATVLRELSRSAIWYAFERLDDGSIRVLTNVRLRGSVEVSTFTAMKIVHTILAGGGDLVTPGSPFRPRRPPNRQIDRSTHEHR